MHNYVGMQHCIVARDLKDYIKKKIKMLEREFCIRVTESDIKHFNELKTEIQIDNYALQLIMR